MPLRSHFWHSRAPFDGTEVDLAAPEPKFKLSISFVRGILFMSGMCRCLDETRRRTLGRNACRKSTIPYIDSETSK
jgi:hypothetical protein